jgi:YVTN family beta-propeller protein
MPPSVLKVFPTNGANNQPLTTRMTLSMSEWPEFATVNATSFFVRPVGGQPIAGKWSCTYTLLNFAPDAPLLPNTTYEIVLPAGGVRDLVGNPVATSFVSTFQTDSGVIGFPGDLTIAPVPPTPLGQATAFSIASSPIPGVNYAWVSGDGVTNAGSSVNHTYATPGRHTVTLRATPSNALYEAENATYGGGVFTGTEHAGFTGTGYADFPAETGAGVFLRFSITALSSGNAHFYFRYANGSGSNRPLQILINGGSSTTLFYPNTGAWTTYGTQTYFNAALTAGINTIEFRATAGSAGANIDSVTVTFPNPQTSTKSFTHIVHRPLTVPAATHSEAMALDPVNGRLWVANPDNDSVTAVDASNLTKIAEFAVGDQPETLDLAPDGTLWVANHGDATISVLSSNGSTVATIALPRASQPYGLVFAPNGSNAFVALQGLGRLVKMNPVSRTVTGSMDLPSDTNGIRPQIRGVAVNGDGTRVYVSRFISPDAHGQVYEVNPSTMSLVRTITLAMDPGPDAPTSGRGIPNYLNAIAINPDGTRLWAPSKKDNIQRGTLRDGNALTHDFSVRAISSSVNLTNGLEIAGERIDYDNRDRAHAVCFSSLGDLAFVSMPGNNHIQVVNTYNGAQVTQMTVQKAPTGVLYDSVHKRLFVLNFLSRSLSVYDVDDLINAQDNVTPQVGSPISLVATDALATNVLAGKQLFYDATSTRLNLEGYMSCASCHLDGGQDGRVWDFTGSGEGLRNTIDLRGKAGISHGRLHWSANFDEVHDFEGQIRDFGAGLGLMENSNFLAGTRSQPLGAPKQGQSVDLDALAAYVASLNKAPSSPFRNTNGTLTADAVLGKQVFEQQNCFACHGGANFTDSDIGGFHDVGTIKPSSGNRLGATLTGIDTPTLRGIWATAPYLHDGSAATLAAVFSNVPPASPHAVTNAVSPAEFSYLLAYLNQIDDTEPAALPASHTNAPTFANFMAAYSAPGESGPFDDADGDGKPNVVEFAAGGTNPILYDDTSALWPFAVAPPSSNVTAFCFTYLRKAGGYWKDGYYRVGELEYRPEASIDLGAWSASLQETENPAGLASPPPGYEWVTYRVTAPPPQNIHGFGRLKIVLP